MATTSSADQLVGVLRDTIVALVRRDGPDLTARQLGVFLTSYLHEGPHTVRGLAGQDASSVSSGYEGGEMPQVRSHGSAQHPGAAHIERDGVPP